MPRKIIQVPDSVFSQTIGIPRRSHEARKHDNLLSNWSLLAETMRKSSNTWLIFPQSPASARNWMASEKVSNIAHPDLEPIGRVQS